MSTDPDTHPATHPATRPAPSFSLGEVGRIIGVATVAGAALGYLVAGYDGDTLEVLARIFGSVAMTIVVFMIFEARRRCRIDRVDARLDQLDARLDQLATLLDERLERDRRWRVYADVLEDLGGVGNGVDGENSTDSGHLPPRP